MRTEQVFERDGATIRHIGAGILQGEFVRWDGFGFHVFVRPEENFDPAVAVLYLAGVASPIEYIWNSPLPRLRGLFGLGTPNIVAVLCRDSSRVIGVRRDDSYRHFGNPVRVPDSCG